jgi:uncharacterized protein with PIN domain
MKFLLTRELGRLSKWLRILGFDAQYYQGSSPATLIIQALRDERVILTRNQHLPLARGVKIVLIKKEKIKGQLQEALEKLKIQPRTQQMFRRCILCNEELAGIAKGEVKDKVPEYVFKTQSAFATCAKCQRIYWQGTHWGNVTSTLKEIIEHR